MKGIQIKLQTLTELSLESEEYKNDNSVVSILELLPFDTFEGRRYVQSGALFLML